MVSLIESSVWKQIFHLPSLLSTFKMGKIGTLLSKHFNKNNSQSEICMKSLFLLFYILFLGSTQLWFLLLIFCYSYSPFSSFHYSFLLFIQHVYVRRRNSFLEVEAIPFQTYTFPTLSHKSPSANRWEGVWCY